MQDARETMGGAVFTIPQEELESIDRFCLENLRMDKDRMRPKLLKAFERTQSESAGRFVCRGMYQGFPIRAIEGPNVHLQSGETLESAVLSEALANAQEAIVFGVAAHGFEELCADAGGSGIDEMFYGGWGVGYSTNAQQWLEDAIRARAHDIGLFTGKSWCPGENDLEMTLQIPLSGLIDLSEIGLEIKDNFAMYPTMSVTGFIAASFDPDIELQKTIFMV